LPLSSKRLWLVLIALIVLGGALPLFHYWYYVGRVPGVTPPEARELLSSPTDTVLVDVRNPARFNEMHIEGAVNWPYEDIASLRTANGIPPQFQQKVLILVCDGGVVSARAAQVLRGRFGVEAFSVTGGIQAWIRDAGGPDGGGVMMQTASGANSPPPFKESPLYEQLALAVAVLVIKPLYMIIALGLIILLWRVKGTEIGALRWGLTSFLAGETACGVNIVFFDHGSYLLEFFHMYGMVVGFSFVTYAIFEALDLKIINYSDPQKKCAMTGICKQCAKYGGGACGLKRIFYFVMPALVVLAFIPLLVSFNPLSYNTTVLGMFYNYSHPIVYQLFELRYAPIYAIIFIGVSFVAFLLWKGGDFSLLKVLFAIGIGPLAFSYLRLIFFGIYHDNLVWPNFWEETTELMYTSGVAFTLWAFQRSLFHLPIKTEPGS
jgi:rhodanese-related sulfurtransferase